MDRSSVDWRGYIPAITTPFTRDRQLDARGLQQLLEWLAAEGMHGIVIAGTTGEWFSLSDAERRALLRVTGRQLRGKLTLIAGCNAFCANRVIEYAEMARESGFDGILVTPPPYIVPNEEEIFAFYRHVSEHAGLPICVYNWPPGTNVDMSCELLERLADLDGIVAVKNSTGRLDRFIQSFFALKIGCGCSAFRWMSSARHCCGRTEATARWERAGSSGAIIRISTIISGAATSRPRCAAGRAIESS